jgi:hypothetical protein
VNRPLIIIIFSTYVLSTIIFIGPFLLIWRGKLIYPLSWTRCHFLIVNGHTTCLRVFLDMCLQRGVAELGRQEGKPWCIACMSVRIGYPCLVPGAPDDVIYLYTSLRLLHLA